MEVLLCPTFWSGEEQLWPNLIRVVTGSEEEVRQALSEENRQVETERITMTTATGRNLSLELELEPLDQQPYCLAIEQIRVYEGDTPLQFMAVEDDVYTPDSFYQGLFLIRDPNIGEPDIRDLNFDGSPDLGLLAESSFPHNVSYVWFLWDEETSRFSFSTYLFSNPTLDVENRQVVEHIRGMWAVRRRQYISGTKMVRWSRSATGSWIGNRRGGTSMKVPHTRLSTHMSGSAKATEQRLRNLFARHKRPALLLVAMVTLAIGLCGGLVACRSTAQAGSLTMDTQYYDALGNYIEIPRLTAEGRAPRR